MEKAPELLTQKPTIETIDLHAAKIDLEALQPQHQ